MNSYMESSKAKEAEALSGGLIYVDFLPQCIRPDSFLHWPEFEPFSTLIPPANSFLREHPHMKVIRCETVHFLVEKDHVRNPDHSEIVIYGEHAKPFVKGLRIWLQPRGPNESDQAQQISYVSFIPSVTPKDNQTLSDLTEQANTWLQQNSISGRILTVESLLIRGAHGELNPDATAWKQKTSLASLTKQTFIQFFRIFYETTPEPCHEDIGFVDFFPKMTEPGGMFRFPGGEGFTEVLGKLNNWAASIPQNRRLLNIQTMLARGVKSTGDPLNVYNACYTDGEFHEFHWRFLRLAFATPRLQAPAPPGYSPEIICSRYFAPGLTRDPKWYKMGELERISVVRERLDTWVRRSGCKVRFVETVIYKTFSGNEKTAGFDSMHTWNEMQYDPNSKSTRPVDEQYVTGFRVYFTGEVKEVEGTAPVRSMDDFRLESRTKSCIIS